MVAQRKRRAKLRRIDYADVSPQAAAIIDGLRTSGTGGDLSSILNEIVVEWAAFRNKIALNRDGPKGPGPGPGPIEPAPGMTPKWIPVAATAR